MQDLNLNTLISKLEYPPKKSQVDGSLFLITKRKALLASKTGAGKTYTSLLATYYLTSAYGDKNKFFIVCDNSGVKKWKEDLEKFFGITPLYVQTLPKVKRYYIYNKWKDENLPYLVISYDLFIKDYVFLEKLICSFKECDYTITNIYDEAHRFKNHETIVHSVASTINKYADFIFAVTRTYDENSPLELYGILSAIDINYIGSFENYLNYFCFYKIEDGRIKVFSIKRPKEYANLKKDKIFEFSEATGSKYEYIDIEVDPSEEQVNLFSALYEGYFRYKVPLETGEDLKIMNHNTAMIYMQFVADFPNLKTYSDFSPKFDKLKELLLIYPKDKWIVYSYSKAVLNEIRKRLESIGIKVLMVTGSTVAGSRVDVTKVFNDPDSGFNVILINNAGNKILDMQAANRLVFFTLPWSGIDYIQTIGRMERNKPLFDTYYVYRLLCGDIDVIKMKVLMRKEKMKNSANKYGSSKDIFKEVYASIQKNKSKLRHQANVESDKNVIAFEGAGKYKCKRIVG